MKKLFFITCFISLISGKALAVSDHPLQAPLSNRNAMIAALSKTEQEQFNRLHTNIAAAKAKLGDHHPLIYNLVEGLGILYQQAGLYPQAREQYQQAMRITEALYPNAQHPNFIIQHCRIASSYLQEGHFATADAYYMHALSLMVHAIGAEHIETAKFIDNLAGIYYQKTLYSQAEPLILEALKLYQKHFSYRHPQMISLLQELKNVYAHTGQQERAKQVQDRLALLTR